MTRSRRIVVGVDGSSASVDALRWAADQAALTGSAIDAVISWQPPTQYGIDAYVNAFDWPALARNVLDGALTEAAVDTFEKLTKTVVEGHPAQVLVAASADADLLVVGSRGHGGFVGLLLGSVSEHVIAHAKCPVLVVRHQS